MQNFKRSATNQDLNEIQKYFEFTLFRGQSFEIDPEHSDLKQKVVKHSTLIHTDQ
jgi:hypothetical protein